ncbi:hypothetical protein OPT61_g5167 [Boeremia exigua]|uniref:Uncharacterized protein n=1 Tax=Boeremia exigua TaxID=749465 RepID=A0ACC2IB80_9PLEO|nr:hypothetical protein OPT61_g5167 [Boeremia exigua]
MAPFTPTLQDVESVLGILASFRLPNELALSVLDQAHYWLEIEFLSEDHVVLVDGGWSLDYSAVYPYLYIPAYPWPRERHLKVREITFTIVSHDQGWTSEDTEGTYQTSSCFEVSILRPRTDSALRRHSLQPGLHHLRDMCVRGETVDGVYAASTIIHSKGMIDLVRRPFSLMEPQRLHCKEMMEVKSQSREEGEHAWYLQGNEDAREKSIFEGEMIKRYTVTWGCADNPLDVTNEGAGSGNGFIENLKQDDFVCIWARVKICSRVHLCAYATACPMQS